MLLVLYTAIALFVLTALYFVVVYPFVCMIECAFSKKLGGSMKAVWIVATFITGVVGAAAYTFFGMQSSKLRSLSIRGMAACLLSFLTIAGLLAAQPQLRKTVLDLAQVDASKMDSLASANVSSPSASSQEGTAATGEVAADDGAPANAGGIQWPAELDWKKSEAELTKSLEQLKSSIGQVATQSDGTKNTSSELVEEIGSLATSALKNLVGQDASAVDLPPPGQLTANSNSEVAKSSELAEATDRDALQEEVEQSVVEVEQAQREQVPPETASSPATKPLDLPSILESAPKRSVGSSAPAQVNRESSRPVNRYRIERVAPMRYVAPVPKVRNRYTGK